MNILVLLLSLGLFTGFVVAIVFERYVVAFILVGFIVLLRFCSFTRKVQNDVTIVPPQKITILGYQEKTVSVDQIHIFEEKKDVY